MYPKEIQCELDSYGSGKGPAVDPYKCGNEPSGSIKGRKFSNQLSGYQLLNKDSTSPSQLLIPKEIITTCHCEKTQR